MDEQFMHFWNDIDHKIRELQDISDFLTLDKLRAHNPGAAVLDSSFADWAGLGDFLLESDTQLTVLECTMMVAAFRDERFLKAAVRKLDCWTMVATRLGRKKIQSLRAAYLASSNSPALRLRRSHCDPELISQLASHLQRLEIGPGDWTQLGEALKQPSSTICDLSLSDIQSSLDWLADALQSQHCKLRRLALKGFMRVPEQLLQALQSPSCRPEGFEVSTTPEDDIPDEGFLLRALMASPSLWFFQTTCSNLSRLLLHEGISKARSISHFVLLVAVKTRDLRRASILIPEFLSSPDCRLQSFVAVFLEPADESPLLQRFQAAVFEGLEGNYHSELQELQLGPWMSRSLEVRCSNLLYRNKLSNDSLAKFVRELSRPPQVLKLFMCGHPGVGKTTIAANLLRSVPVPAFLQWHASTQGISLRNLEFGGKNLVIFDLAGQEVYHAFHHYFVRRSENDLFLIVCKLEREKSEDPEQSLAALKRLLTYWLRFIVSHRSASSQTKPKVFVVLNYFCKPSKLQYNAPTAVNEVLELFRTEVNLKDVLEVVALKARKLSKLRESLMLAAEDTVRHLQPVPKVCNDFIARKHARKWYKRQSMTHEEKTVLRLDELKGWLPDTGDEVARSKALKFTLLCLHNMGEAIYFGSAEEDSELDNHAILDVPWFVQDVIRKFIPKLPRNDDRCAEKAVVGINPLHESLRQIIRADQKNPESTVDIIVKYLEAMGLIIPDWKASDQVITCSTKSSQDGKKKKEQHTGVFSIIQADIAKLCKDPAWQNQRSLELGDGWISFDKDSVRVLVLVGGDNERWMDRQWVDIMLMVPEDNIRCVEAETILSSMRNCTLDLQLPCPFLRLEEHVSNPTNVKALLLHEEEEPNTHRETILLEDLKHINGLEFSWGPGSRSFIGELLMLSELRQLLESRQSVVDDFNSIAPVYELEQTTSAISQFADPEHPEIERLADYLTGHFQQVEGLLKQLKVSMKTMQDTLCTVERSLKVDHEHIRRSLSKMLQHITVPKFPYLTDEKNMFFKYSNLAGTSFRIHYMCESGQQRHQLDHDKYKGVPVTIAHDWIKKYASVLVPAIMVSFLIAKIGTAAAGIPVKEALDFAEERLKATINSCFGQSINITQPAEHEVEEVLEHVKKAAGEQNLKVLMAKYFGLFFHKGAWVCEKHKL